MIAWLSGSVIHRDVQRGSVTLAVRGVGYEISVFTSALEILTPGSLASENVTLWIHSVTRDDGTVLFGFRRVEERELFRLLLTVPSVGPKSALAVLGAGKLASLVTVLERGDTKTLQKSPGIGKRTAEQIVLSLKEKIGAFAHLRDPGSDGDVSRAPDGGVGPQIAVISGHEALIEEAAQSLVVWGFRLKGAKGAAEAAVAQLMSQEPAGRAIPLEEVLRIAMRGLSHGS